MWAELKKYRKEFISLNLNENINYEKFSMISIVYNSTKIEGCSLDENDTRILIENNITAKGKPLTDHLMDQFNYRVGGIKSFLLSFIHGNGNTTTPLTARRVI